MTFSKNGPWDVHSGFHKPGVACTAAVIPSRSSSHSQRTRPAVDSSSRPGGLPRPEAGYTRLDVAVTVMDERHAARSFGFAASAREAGLRASVYLGSSGKLGRQLKWASDTGARWALIYGGTEDETNTVTVRDMTSGDQTAVPVNALTGFLAGLADAAE